MNVRLACSFLLGSAALVGCATTSEIRPSASQKLALHSVHQALTHRGFLCTLEDTSTTCQSDSTYVVVFEYRQEPRILLVNAWFENKASCEEQAGALEKVNRDWLVQAACVDDSLRFSSWLLVPESGLSGSDVHDYLVWWSSVIWEAGTAAGLFEKDDENKGQGADDDAKPAPADTRDL